MSVKEDLLNYVEKYCDEVNQAILDRKFQILSRDEHTTTIIVNDEYVVIWMANTPEYTRVYSIRFGDASTFFVPQFKFKKAKECREILSTLTKKEKEAIRKKLEENNLKLEEMLNEGVK